jgi:hypothetical protein
MGLGIFSDSKPPFGFEMNKIIPPNAKGFEKNSLTCCVHIFFHVQLKCIL